MSAELAWLELDAGACEELLDELDELLWVDDALLTGCELAVLLTAAALEDDDEASDELLSLEACGALERIELDCVELDCVELAIAELAELLGFTTATELLATEASELCTVDCVLLDDGLVVAVELENCTELDATLITRLDCELPAELIGAVGCPELLCTDEDGALALLCAADDCCCGGEALPPPEPPPQAVSKMLPRVAVISM